MKTCIWCAIPCAYYFKVVMIKADEMFGEEAEAYRIQTANDCSEYSLK